MGLVEELGKNFIFDCDLCSKMKIYKAGLTPKFGDSIILYFFFGVCENMLRQEDAKLSCSLEV